MCKVMNTTEQFFRETEGIKIANFTKHVIPQCSVYITYQTGHCWLIFVGLGDSVIQSWDRCSMRLRYSYDGCQICTRQT